MGNRSILCGAATVEVDMTRYDELLRKEERLNIIASFAKNPCTPVEVLRVIINGISVENREIVEDAYEVKRE